MSTTQTRPTPGPPPTRRTGSIEHTSQTRPCAVIEAEFVFGATTCGENTPYVETLTGDRNPICLSHIEAQRSQ